MSEASRAAMRGGHPRKYVPSWTLNAVKKILLHACCAPCAVSCLERLRSLDYDTTLFFSNANLAPMEEWRRRLDAVRQLAQRVQVPLLEDETSHAEWLDAVRGFAREPEGGERCRRCFAYSLARTRDRARALAMEGFTTSLTVSPHKRSQVIFDVGRALAPDHFLALDFKKNNGFLRSVERARQYGLYRQDYCGCEFSLAASRVRRPGGERKA